MEVTGSIAQGEAGGFVSINDVFYKSPRALQNVVMSAGGAVAQRQRYSGLYRELEEEYRLRGDWNADRLRVFARLRRAQTLALASSTPYYASVLRDLGADWFELMDDDAFAQIPVTTKEALRDDPEAFAPRKALPTDTHGRTSGTTGVSLTVLRSETAVQEQWAVWWRYRGWHGIERGERCAFFGGKRIMRESQRNVYWRHNLLGNELRFSSYHIGRTTAPAYVDRLNAYGARWIHGFASSISLLASEILEAGLQVTAPVRWITLGGDNVTRRQMNMIEAAFGVRPIQHYGLAEGVANLSTCAHGLLHVDEDFAGVEFDPLGDGTSRVLGTSFANRARVLLRYDTSDVVRVDAGDSCTCGFGGRVVRCIDGRGDETIRLPDGRVVRSPENALVGDFGLAGIQMLQRRSGEVVVSYVRGPSWRDGAVVDLERDLRESLGQEVPLIFQEVDELTRTGSGKLRLVLHEV